MKTTVPVPAETSNNIAHTLGVCLAIAHLLITIAFAIYIHGSVDPQAPLLWGVLAVTDFPLSLLYFFSSSIPRFDQSWLGQLFYLPYIFLGLFGTIWWYFLPRLLMPRRLGWVW